MAFKFYGYYCDDVRHEVSGKVSLIGCYGGEIWIGQLPFVFQKIHISFVVEAVEPDKVLPSQMRIVTEINGEEKGSVRLNYENENSEVPHSRLDAGYAIINLEITEPCEIKSFLLVDEQRIPGPSAKICLKNQQQ